MLIGYLLTFAQVLAGGSVYSALPLPANR